MIAQRYAKAIFNLAEEEGDCKELGRELQSFLTIFEEVAELRNLLLNPARSLEEKSKAIIAINQSNQFSHMTLNFILFLIKKRRLSLFPEICEFYESFLDKKEGRLRAEISLAMEAKDTVIQEIKKKLEEVTGKQVILRVKIDSNLIGGVIVKSGDMVYDGSVRSQLEKLEVRLKEGVV